MTTGGKRAVAVRQLAWLAAIWLLSVMALGVFAELFRLLMAAAGLTASGGS